MGSNTAQILLTADWRLHEVCEGIIRVNPASTERLAHAPRDAVRRVVDFAIDEQVDVLVNAGNTLVPNLACPSDYKFLYGELERLERQYRRRLELEPFRRATELAALLSIPVQRTTVYQHDPTSYKHPDAKWRKRQFCGY